MAGWAGAPTLVFGERKQLFEIFTMVARPEVPLPFALNASRPAALLTECLPVMDAVVLNEHAASLFIAVSAIAAIDLCTPGQSRLH